MKFSNSARGKSAMRDYLAFFLSGPMGSFGGYAGLNRRGTEIAPLRSAILGIVGAGLGIDRSDAIGQGELRKYFIASRPLQKSSPLRDFHTAQTVSRSTAKNPATRAEALAIAGANANTSITVRDYQCDVMFGVVLWGDGHWALQDIVDGLERPRWPLYIGRKSCPLACPLNPRIVSAANPVDALADMRIPDWLPKSKSFLHDQGGFSAQSDMFDGQLRPDYVERVPGDPIDREEWTFGESMLWHLTAEGSDRGDTQ